MRGCLACLALVAFQLAAPATSESLKTYESSAYGWTVTYPGSWRVDDSRADAVMLASEELRSLCGIHARTVRFETADRLADFMLDDLAHRLEAKGLQSKTLWRRDIRLRTGQPAVEALVAMRPGGMSHRIFAVVSHQGFGVDCEAEDTSWTRVTKAYDAIIASFGIAGE